MLMILCLVGGGLIGAALRIERLERLGKRVEQKFSGLGGNFARGFITASLVYCVGAMAVVGAWKTALLARSKPCFPNPSWTG